jgi:hypothetical protein
MPAGAIPGAATAFGIVGPNRVFSPARSGGAAPPREYRIQPAVAATVTKTAMASAATFPRCAPGRCFELCIETPSVIAARSPYLSYVDSAGTVTIQNLAL